VGAGIMVIMGSSCTGSGFATEVLGTRQRPAAWFRIQMPEHVSAYNGNLKRTPCPRTTFYSEIGFDGQSR